MTTINTTGASLTRAFVQEHHLRGHNLQPNHLDAWVEEAQDNLDNTGVAYIEIRSFDSTSGSTMMFEVPDEHIEP